MFQFSTFFSITCTCTRVYMHAIADVAFQVSIAGKMNVFACICATWSVWAE